MCAEQTDLDTPTAYAMGFLGCASVKERLGGFPGLKSVVSALPGYTIKPLLNIGNIINATYTTPYSETAFQRGLLKVLLELSLLVAGAGFEPASQGVWGPQGNRSSTPQYTF